MAENQQGTPVDLTRTAGEVSEGVHTVRIIDWEQREGNAGPYWNYTLEVQEDSVDNGKRLWHIVSLSPAARWRLEEFLDAVGAPRSGQAFGPDFVGSFMRVHVKHEEFDGKMRARIVGVLPPSGAKGSKTPAITPRKRVVPSPAPSPAPSKKLPEDVIGDEDEDEDAEL